MLSRCALVLLLAALVAAPALASPLEKFDDIDIEAIFQSIIDSVSSAVTQLQSFVADNADAITEFLTTTSKQIVDLIDQAAKNAQEAIRIHGNLDLASISKLATDLIRGLTTTLRTNIGTLVKKLTAPATSRDNPPVDPALLLAALKTHLSLMADAVNANSLLYKVYNKNSEGLLGGVTGALTDNRMNLLNALGDSVKQLCDIKNDSSGSLADSTADATTALNGIQTAAQSATSGCNGLGCILLIPRAAQIVKSTLC